MASTYSELKDEIAAYTMRDVSELPLANIIALAEADISGQGLTHYLMEKSTTVTSVGNTVTLPSDHIETIFVGIGDVVLTPVSIYGGTLETDEIGYYKVGNTLKLVRSESTDVGVDLVYRARLPKLSDANPTNWLLTNFPHVYHHAASARAYHYLKDMQAMQAEKAMLAEALAAIETDNARLALGGNQITMEDTSW